MRTSDLLREKIAHTHIIHFENGSYLLSTSGEGMTSASFQPGLFTVANGKTFPDDMPGPRNLDRLDDLDEEHPIFQPDEEEEAAQ